MDTINVKMKVVWALAAPYCTALYGMAGKSFAWVWAALLVSLKPFWVPAVTLARNPLTAVVVCVLVIGAYITGDRVRAVRDYVTVSKMMRTYEARLAQSAATLKENATLFVKEKADLVSDVEALKRRNAELEQRLNVGATKAAPAGASQKYKAVAPAQKSNTWSWF